MFELNVLLMLGPCLLQPCFHVAGPLTLFGEDGRTHIPRPTARAVLRPPGVCGKAADLRTDILDFGGFDSSINLISRGGILMSKGNLTEVLSQ